jgi:tRNA-splicing ligase RtcB
VENLSQYPSRVPILSWAPVLDDKTITQIKNIANLPFAFNHVAIMPDAHAGYGMPIGGVLATNGVVIPNAVGVDIGCGMRAVETTLTAYNTESLKKVMDLIRERIPMGFQHHATAQNWNGFSEAPNIPIIEKELPAATYQLGTLGGGNHFLEIQADTDGKVWLMLHSGSRNFGLKIANTYHKMAYKFCEMWHSGIPDMDLSFLPLEIPEAREYIEAMRFAVNFAKESRARMLLAMQQSLSDIFPETMYKWAIDIPHNYARMENHFGANVMVHRKGAIYADKDTIGIIPGSQGTASYIVKGLGNKASFMSCSHGAGRKLGRKQACRELNLASEQAALEKSGIIHSVRSITDLEEAPGAYKDIDEVMRNQTDLVTIEKRLKPLAVLKG